MDPIHPILPVTDRIPTVTGVPRVERTRRRPTDQDGRRRAPDESHSQAGDGDELDGVHVDLHADLPDEDEDGDARPHVDITV
jgi:hypothetical protein